MYKKWRPSDAVLFVTALMAPSSRVMKKTVKAKCILITAVLVVLPSSVWADTAVIKNTVKPSANTGGQDSLYSDLGQATSHVQIKTVVNGEVMEDIDETVVMPSGENAVIEKKIEITMPSNKAEDMVEIQEWVEDEDSIQIEEKEISVVTFLSKIFKYVFSIFKV